MYYLYILQCKDGSLYTGVTNDLKRRLSQHQSGSGAKYTRTKQAEKIVYSEKHPDKSSALKRELEIKSWTRSQKLALIREASLT